MLPCYTRTGGVENHLHGHPAERVSQMCYCFVCRLPGYSPKRASPSHVFLDFSRPLFDCLVSNNLAFSKQSSQFASNILQHPTYDN